MRAYFTTDAVTSSGLHIEFLRRSVEIIEKAPLIGHGTVYRPTISRHSGRRIGRQKRHLSESSQSDLCCCDSDRVFRRNRVDSDVDCSFHAVSRRRSRGMGWHRCGHRKCGVVGGALSFVRFQSGLAVRLRHWRRWRHDVEALPVGRPRDARPSAFRAQKLRGATPLAACRPATLRFEQAPLGKTLREPRARRARRLLGRRASLRR